jgi:hypothetical protein
MPPIWDPRESEDDGIYELVARHSPGMISFTYQPDPSEEVLEALKDTTTFRSLSSSGGSVTVPVRLSAGAKELAKLTAE